MSSPKVVEQRAVPNAARRINGQNQPWVGNPLESEKVPLQ
jgi:hypothetical protein